nr:MAG TPA: hypothetical protein [Caudoviricetes sp.]
MYGRSSEHLGESQGSSPVTTQICFLLYRFSCIIF